MGSNAASLKRRGVRSASAPHQVANDKRSRLASQADHRYRSKSRSADGYLSTDVASPHFTEGIDLSKSFSMDFYELIPGALASLRVCLMPSSFKIVRAVVRPTQ